jgi:uncharacterized coiled-coil DUF342 family protein
MSDSEEQLRICKAEVKDYRERASHVRQREIQISNQMREERGKLDELNLRLDQLMREIEDSRPQEKSSR